jgi:hypothetical protein
MSTHRGLRTRIADNGKIENLNSRADRVIQLTCVTQKRGF